MASLRTYALCVLATFAFVAPVNGEAVAMVEPPAAGGDGDITVDPTLTAGTECDVNYSHPELANTTVTVRVHDGMGGDPEEIEIELDDAGNGTGKWVVQGWESGAAVFEEDNAKPSAATIY